MNPGLYIHIPFCLAKCSYCHFISLPYDQTLANQYKNAVCMEIERNLSAGTDEQGVDSIYFGGGTPSLVPVTHISRILAACRSRFAIGNDCEISLEANPGTLSGNKILALRKCAINRISMGAQSFVDQELSSIGRLHSVDMIFDSLRQLKRGGFDNINLDLMLGLPGQTKESWERNLKTFAQLEVPHISVYMLDLDDQSPLAELVASGSISTPEDDLISDLYLETIEFLSSHGYEQYEISNFARPGYACRHNLKYWMRNPVLGFGLGSHSFDGKTRYANTSLLSDYLEAIDKGLSPVSWREPIGAVQSLQETLFLGLRLTKGIELAGLDAKHGANALSKYTGLFQDFSDRGLIQWDGVSIRLTPSGMLLSNEIFQQFV